MLSLIAGGAMVEFSIIEAPKSRDYRLYYKNALDRLCFGGRDIS